MDVYYFLFYFFLGAALAPTSLIPESPLLLEWIGPLCGAPAATPSRGACFKYFGLFVWTFHWKRELSASYLRRIFNSTLGCQ